MAGYVGAAQVVTKVEADLRDPLHDQVRGLVQAADVEEAAVNPVCLPVSQGRGHGQGPAPLLNLEAVKLLWPEGVTVEIIQICLEGSTGLIVTVCQGQEVGHGQELLIQNQAEGISDFFFLHQVLKKNRIILEL